MKLELFGHPQIVREADATPLPFTKPAYLLVYLACRGGWVTRDELVLFFRPDADESTARQGLRTSLTRARKLTWAQGLEQEGDRLRFTPESDLSAFRAALGEGDWESVAALYRGEFLAGAPGLGLATFENWLEVEGAALASAWQGAALKHAAALTEAEEHEKAARLLARVVQHDPLAEDVLQAYLRSSYLAGEASAALLAFNQFKKQLKAELDLAPLAETEALAETVKRSGSLTPTFPQTKVKAGVPLTVLRPPTLIGREAEKRVLLAEGVRLGVVSGEAGVGKSRFVSEIVPNARWLRCREGLTQVPYFPIIEVIKGLDNLPHVLAELGVYRADLARLIPELSEAEAPPTDSEAAKARLLEALARVLESQKSPLVFDDLQWADSATLEFFVFMAHRTTLNLYATVRSNERSDRLKEVLGSLRSVAGFTRIELAPLGQDAITDLLTSLSPETGEAQAFSGWLATKSGGNPFFLLETLRALFEAQMLEAGTMGWYSSLDSVTRGYAELAIPSGVAALVERRVNGLSDTAKRVLDVACVVAEDIKPELVAELVGLSVWAVSDAFAELEVIGLFENERFSHDLTRQALYGTLLENKRRFLHEQVANHLPTADELIRAEHYYRAGNRAKAADLWFQVARFRFAEGNFVDEATTLLERVLALGIDTPAVHRAQARLAGLYHSLNRTEEKDVLIRTVLQKSHDPYARAFALLEKTKTLFLKGKIAEAEKALFLAEKQVIDFDDLGLQQDVFHARVYVDYYQGRFDSALELGEYVLAEKRRSAVDHGTLNWLGTLAHVYCAVGRFEEALECYYEAYEIAKTLNFARSQMQSASDIMATLYDLERIQEGVALGEEALALGKFDVIFPLRYHLALAYFEQKRFEDVLKQCSAVLSGDSSVNIRSHTYALLAEVYLEQDDKDKVYEAVNDGLALIEAVDHNEARAVMVVAALKFGTADHVERVKPLVTHLSEVNLPTYLQKDFDAAVALKRHSSRA